jgi:HK97 family phage portal protein
VGILGNLFTIRGLSLTDEKAWNPSLWNLFGSQSVSGETVTEYTALTYSAFWCAVSLISGTISTLPLHLMQRKKDDKKRIAYDRKLYRVLHDEANPYMTAKQLRECMMAHVLIWGNGYAEIVRDGYGEVVQLWPIFPSRVTPFMEGQELKYKISMTGEADIILPRERILHIAGPSPDGFLGYSVVALARKSIGLAMAMETFGARYFGHGAHPGLVITHPGKLSPDGHKNLESSLQSRYEGLGHSHRIMLLEEDMKYEKVGIPPNDSQFLESRQFQIPEVARWFNLPPHKLKDLTRSSFNNIESEQISFVTDSILPWLVTLEQFYNMQLLSKSDKEQSGRGRYYFKHNFEGLLRADAESRGKFYQSMFNVGGMSINRILGKEDIDPIDHPFADEPFVPLNMVPLSLLEKYLEKGAAAKEADQDIETVPKTSPNRRGGPAK